MKRVQSSIYRSLFSKCRWLPLFLFLFLILLSCSGGGIGGSGVSAGSSTSSGDTTISGNTSIGPITGLGSIVVTDNEFATTGATVKLAGVGGDVADLQTGMVVKVEGYINSTNKTGKADVIVFEPNAEGPISGIDLGNSSLTLMGQTVLVDGQTVFAGLPGNAPSLADLAIDDLVEISGLADADGNIRATRIAKKALGRQPEVLGRVSSLTGMAFKINALDIDYSSATLSKFGSGGIQPDDFVLVKGYLTSPTALLADSVERRVPDFKYGYIEIEGFVDSLVFAEQTVSGFTIITPFGLQLVSLTAATEFSGGQIADIKSGARVEVEGTFQSNVVQAKKLMFF